MWFKLAAEYRRLRKECPPDTALGIIQVRLQFALQLLIAAGRPNAATDLEVLLGYVQVNLELAEGRRLQQGRSAEFWRTGHYSNPLVFRVQAWDFTGPLDTVVTCDNPGCAIKHALAMFRDATVTSVTIDPNRPGTRQRLSRHTTLQLLNELDWPVA